MKTLNNLKQNPWSLHLILACCITLWFAGLGPLTALSEPTIRQSNLSDNAKTNTPHDLKQKIEKQKSKSARAEACFVIKAPREVVWRALTDFPRYPHIFHRIKDCRVIKQEGDLIFIESELMPQMFVRTARNHTVNNLGGRPSVLDWKLLDGNFKDVRGKWELSPSSQGNCCQVTYILEVDPGPVIPSFLFSFALGLVQREIVSSLKDWVESEMPQADAHSQQATSESPT